MALDGLDDADIVRILKQTRRIALVGASNRPERPSHEVMGFLLGRGWAVTPVNPGLAGQTLLGQRVVASLEEAGPLDMVDIFRAADQAGAVVDEAIRLGARTVWMQLGVIDHAGGRAGAQGRAERGDASLPGNRGAAAGSLSGGGLNDARRWAMSKRERASRAFGVCLRTP